MNCASPVCIMAMRAPFSGTLRNVTLLNFGKPGFQYLSLRVTFSVSALQLTNLKAPVPTGLRVMSRPYCWIAFGLSIIAAGCAMVGMKAPNGVFSTTRAVLSSSASTWSTIENRLVRLRWFAGLLTRSRFAFTAAALNGVSSWKLIPVRSLNTNSVPSSFAS